MNTNLEEMSDWLTKILVGATLTQIGKIPGMVGLAAKYMAPGIGGRPWKHSPLPSLCIFQPWFFLAGYVVTRMFFSRAFSRSDSAASSDADARLLQAQNARVATGEDQHLPENILESAQKSLFIPITGALSAQEAGAVARGALIVGQPDRALRASSLAVRKKPGDVRSQQDYATRFLRRRPTPKKCCGS